jgi:Domain of unknown function (DUF6916)
MAIAAGNPHEFHLRFHSFRFEAPGQTCTKWGNFPKNGFCRTGPQKNQIFPMLLSERRWNLAFSRRIFLRHGVLAAAACAANPFSAMAFGGRHTTIGSGEEDDLHSTPGAGSEHWRDHASALDHLGRNAFSGAIGTNFQVFTGAAQLPVWVTLLAVEDLPAIAPVNPASFAVPNKRNGFAPSNSGFVLLFGGSSPLPQQTHLFEHQALGRFALFTVPEGNGQQIYTAVVNRLDAAAVIAAPYSAGQVAQPASSGAPAAGGFNAPAAISSTDEIPSLGLSGSPGVQRGAVRD